MLTALSVAFEDSLATTNIEQRIERLEAAIRQPYREVTAIFVKAQSTSTWKSRGSTVPKRHV